MEKMVACCGLACTDCEAYIATRDNDDRKRQEIAEKWAKQFGHEMKPGDINCAGCTAEGPHIGYCGICQIRGCAQGKGVSNCGWCDDYSCDKTEAFFKMAPQCKTTLDAIKQSRG
jgi:hypothetical protein